MKCFLHAAVLILLGVVSLPASAQSAKPPEKDYPVHPDSVRQDGVPKGVVTSYKMTSSKIFPGTERDWWIYVPAQYDAAKPACLMVFNDGGGYVTEKGQSRIPIVFDNLINKGVMPVTIGVFINPGVVPAANPEALPRFNRSFEYDGMGDRYARFLETEVLPLVYEKYNVDRNPDAHGICGSSSGAICAFTAAWERPDLFRRVYSIVGTFVGLRGGQDYATLVRKTEPKPLRVFLQDGSNDLNIYCGDWFVANQGMLSALTHSGYEVDHLWGEGYHGQKQGGAIMADVMTWLWKDYPKAVTTHYDQRGERAADFLLEGVGWQAAGEGFAAISDGPVGSLLAIGRDGAVRQLAVDGTWRTLPGMLKAGAVALMPDGSVAAAVNNDIVVRAADGAVRTLASGITADALTVGHNGNIYAADAKAGAVWLIRADGSKTRLPESFPNCSGLSLSADQTLLSVADRDGRFVANGQLAADGTLQFVQPYHHLHTTANEAASGAAGMCGDRDGWLLVATAMGIQICDQPGRVNMIVPQPLGSPQPRQLVLAGAAGDNLYALCGDNLFVRQVKLHAAPSSAAPVKPPKPRL